MRHEKLHRGGQNHDYECFRTFQAWLWILKRQTKLRHSTLSTKSHPLFVTSVSPCEGFDRGTSLFTTLLNGLPREFGCDWQITVDFCEMWSTWIRTALFIRSAHIDILWMTFHNPNENVHAEIIQRFVIDRQVKFSLWRILISDLYFAVYLII